MKRKKITKKEIVVTLRSYNVTRICKLYKKLYNEVPTKHCSVYVDGQRIEYKCLDGFELYTWASDYATSRKMDKMLYGCLNRASHQWQYSCYDEPYRHAPHGIYEPLRKQYVVEELVRQCQNPTSNYAKRPVFGHTHLYFCSPVYGHSDYNKWRAIEIKGNEAFCEAVIKYADKFFKNNE